MAINSNFILFLKRFIQNPKQIGAIAPTSLTTARIMAEPIASDATVLELGAGTGVITHAVLEHIKHADQLTSVEIDPELAKILHQNFPDIKINIEDIEETLQRDIQYDVIISGIPFINMDRDKRTRVFKLIKERLKPNGSFIAFQYRHVVKKELEALFSNIEITYSPRNLPPAIIYFCRKS